MFSLMSSYERGQKSQLRGSAEERDHERKHGKFTRENRKLLKTAKNMRKNLLEFKLLQKKENSRGNKKCLNKNEKKSFDVKI